MRLTAYILKNVGTRIVAAILVLLGVLQILDLLEVTPDIISRGLGAAGMAHYALLRLPRLFDQAAPLGVLAGCIFAFMKLAGDSEIVAMRSTGVSTYRILAMALPAALIVAAADFTAVEFVAPRTDAALQTWWSGTAPPTDKTAPKPHAFRVGGDLVIAQTGDHSGRTLSNVAIYRRDAAGRLVERIRAGSAVYVKDAGWRLNNPEFARFDVGPVPQVGRATQMTWAQSFEPADVQTLFFGDDTISAASARRALSGGGSQRPASYYATRLQRAVATPIGAIVMLLLALPVALASFRSSRGAVFVTGSLAAGLIFLVADGMLSALGESGAVSPIIAAWTAPAVFAALAATMLLRLEG